MADLTVDPLRGAPRSYISRGKRALGLETLIFLKENAPWDIAIEIHNRARGKDKEGGRRGGGGVDVRKKNKNPTLWMWGKRKREERKEGSKGGREGRKEVDVGR